VISRATRCILLTGVHLDRAGDWVEYRILGRTEVLHAGAPLSISAPRHRRLLSVLLVHADDIVPVQRLIEELWGHDAPPSAGATLHVRISELRNLLREGHEESSVGILTRGSGYQLVLGPDDLDARSFERLSAAGHGALRQGNNIAAGTRLTEALACWRGPALSDLADDEFAQAEIARLEALHVQALEDKLDVELALGRHAEVVAQLCGLVAQHPLHERFWCQLMLAQYRAGRQADALQSYTEARDRLVEELGIEPGPDLQRLHTAILSQDPALNPPAPLTPAKEVPNNLPRRLTSFVGRDAETERIKRLLSQNRLVTVVGPGGVGKSRLVLEVAHGVRDAYVDGVWLVELAAVTAPDRVVSAVAAAAGVREHPEQTMTELLVDRFASRPSLLILDNCEHLLDAAAGLAQQLLESCPHLAVLATSRERLGVTGEVLEPLPGLSLPDGPSRHGPSSDSEELFADRARDTYPGLDLAGSADAVAQICRRLDGMPLAIELAAARVNALSVEEIAGRLDDRFLLLNAGQRTAETRHRTLRAVVAWSYSMLTEEEARFFDAASVFVGGFTLNAAEAVCADPAGGVDVAGLLWRLVDKSLIASENVAGARRYRILETLRAYGQERLTARRELDQVQHRHAEYILAFGEPALAGLRGIEQPMWLDRLELEHGNIRAALAWALAQGRAETAVRLAGAVYSLWDLHGHYSEGTEWLRKVLALEGEVAPPVRARALLGLATLATIQGDSGTGAAACQEAAALSAEVGDATGLAHAQQYLGLGCVLADDYDMADALLRDSLTHAREADDSWLEAWALVFLIAVDLGREDHAGALRTAQISRRAADAAGDPECVAWAKMGLAAAQLFSQGDMGAMTELRDALVAFVRLGAVWGMSVTVSLAALLAADQRRPTRTLRLSSAQERLRASVGASELHFVSRRLAAAVRAARAHVGDAAADEADRAGAAMSLSEIAAEALAEFDNRLTTDSAPEVAHHPATPSSEDSRLGTLCGD
jgi:predicted ATPase/DNA-binding SARP family transcriptional activator